MLIVCVGPNSFKARKKYQDLILAYRGKFSDAAIDQIDDNFWLIVLTRLGNGSLFSSKKMLVGEQLLSKMTAKDVDKLKRKIIVDDNETVVLDYEEKLNKTKMKLLNKIDKKYLFIYEYPELKSWELKKEVVELVRKYGVDVKYVDYLIERYSGDVTNKLGRILIFLF